MQPQQSLKDKLQSIKFSLKLAAGLYGFTIVAALVGNKLLKGRAESVIFSDAVLALALVCCAVTLWLAYLLVKYLTARV